MHLVKKKDEKNPHKLTHHTHDSYIDTQLGSLFQNPIFLTCKLLLTVKSLLGMINQKILNEKAYPGLKFAPIENSPRTTFDEKF